MDQSFPFASYKDQSSAFSFPHPLTSLLLLLHVRFRPTIWKFTSLGIMLHLREWDDKNVVCC